MKRVHSSLFSIFALLVFQFMPQLAHADEQQRATISAQALPKPNDLKATAPPTVTPEKQPATCPAPPCCGASTNCGTFDPLLADGIISRAKEKIEKDVDDKIKEKLDLINSKIEIEINFARSNLFYLWTLVTIAGLLIVATGGIFGYIGFNTIKNVILNDSEFINKIIASSGIDRNQAIAESKLAYEKSVRMYRFAELRRLSEKLGDDTKNGFSKEDAKQAIQLINETKNDSEIRSSREFAVAVNAIMRAFGQADMTKEVEEFDTEFGDIFAKNSTSIAILVQHYGFLALGDRKENKKADARLARYIDAAKNNGLPEIAALYEALLLLKRAQDASGIPITPLPAPIRNEITQILADVETMSVGDIRNFLMFVRKRDADFKRRSETGFSTPDQRRTLVLSHRLVEEFGEELKKIENSAAAKASDGKSIADLLEQMRSASQENGSDKGNN